MSRSTKTSDRKGAVVRRFNKTVFAAGVTLGLLAGGTAAVANADDSAPEHTAPDSLRGVAPEGLKIGGAAAGGGHHGAADYPDPFHFDEEYRELIATEFSSLTPENQLKWDHLRPAPGEYDFADADAIVEFAEQNDQVVRGHTLFWHSQNPEWVENGDFTPEELREILHDHITTVVERYAGRIDQWEVANEIFHEDGTLRMEDNIWLRELGTDIIADAFHWAHEADPDALLFFNDYNVEGINAKTDGYYALITDLLEQGVPVHGFGLQSHLGTMYGYDPSLPDNLARFGDLGLKTAITELDVRMDLTGGEPTPEMIEEQNEFFAFVLESCLAEASCDSFTLWGASDKYSWVPVTFEGEGSATPWTDDLERKPAYYAMYDILLAASGNDSVDDADGAADGGAADADAQGDATGDADASDADVNAGADTDATADADVNAGTDTDASADADGADGAANGADDSAAPQPDDTEPVEDTPQAPVDETPVDEAPADAAADDDQKTDTSGTDLAATGGSATPLVFGAAGLLMALGLTFLIARRVQTQS
nr:endo-1,4-beta-xylanase [Microbacterium amylolyticum]